MFNKIKTLYCRVQTYLMLETLKRQIARHGMPKGLLDGSYGEEES